MRFWALFEGMPQPPHRTAARDAQADSLQRLRDLRRTVRELNSTMNADLTPFLHKNEITFRRLPYTDLPLPKMRRRIRKSE
jgi:hypothetical protein